MKLHRQIIFQKITSLFLLALILFINAVKLFHTHPQVPQKQEITKTFFAVRNAQQNLAANDRCAICEFNFIKDADLTVMPVIEIPVREINTALSSKLPVFLSFHHFAISGRAPPSVA